MKAKRLTFLNGLLAASLLLGALVTGRDPAHKSCHGAGVDSAAPSEVGATNKNAAATSRDVSLDRPTSPDVAANQPIPDFALKLAATLEVIQKETNPGEREKRLVGLLGEISAAELSAALTFIKEQSSSDLNREFGLRLVSRWGHDDPRAAALWVNINLVGWARERAIKAIATAWAEKDVASALTWVYEIPDEAARHSALVNIAYEAGRSEPIKGLEIAVSLPSSEARDALIEHTASEWAGTAPRLAADWASQIPDEALRARVLSEIATSWGASDPVAAVEMALKELKAGKPQEDAIVSIVQQWTQTKPEDAAAWVTQFPEGELRHTALEELVKLWFDQDAQGAARWLNSLEPGETTDVAFSTYVEKTLPHSPEIAALWAEHIINGDLRSRQITAVGKAWMNVNPSAAEAWLARESSKPRPLTESAP